MRWLTEHLGFKLFTLSGHPVTTLALLALVMTIGGAIIAGIVTRRMLHRLLVRRTRGVNVGLAYALSRIGQYVVFVIGTLIGLENVGLSLTTLTAFGAVLTVGIGFGLQNIAQNFISGLILLIERPVQQGDFIKVGDTVGRVDEIAMRATRVISRDGVAVIVPNSELITATVVNQSAGSPNYRARIKIGVAYGTDLAAMRKVLLDLAHSHADVLHDPEHEARVFFREFGESAQEFELTVWLNDPQREPYVTSDLRFAIDGAFREHGIVIPFPQRVLHLHDDTLAELRGTSGMIGRANG